MREVIPRLAWYLALERLSRDGDGLVNVTDFLILLGQWGSCPQPCPPACTGDLDGNCEVNVNDFLILLANWT